ncbi:hypothetical protein WS62_19920 [Burkholderia sp. ABCPW 14]|nr:hypothetical protein WS62_19920 [Burkholderia sp. ABCPW 14]
MSAARRRLAAGAGKLGRRRRGERASRAGRDGMRRSAAHACTFARVGGALDGDMRRIASRIVNILPIR